jgi:hypothetical protein
MTRITKLLAGAAGVAALAAAAPAAAQYPYGYGYNSYSPYGYNTYSPYGTAYGAYGVNTQAAAQQCTAAVQNRLYTRTGLSSIITSLFGLSGTSPRVLSVTQVRQTRNGVQVRGLATSGRYAYNPYGAGYYGAVASGYSADLSFKCNVDYRGYVRDVDIDRR